MESENVPSQNVSRMNGWKIYFKLFSTAYKISYQLNLIYLLNPLSNIYPYGLFSVKHIPKYYNNSSTPMSLFWLFSFFLSIVIK